MHYPHEPSGEECTAGEHFDGRGACQTCRHCHQSLRPQFMGDLCPARRPQPHHIPADHDLADMVQALFDDAQGRA